MSAVSSPIRSGQRAHRRILARWCFDIAANGDHPGVGTEVGAGDDVAGRLAIRLPAEPESARRARQFVVAALAGAGWRDQQRLDHLALVTSELVTNAVVHAGTALEVGVSCNQHEARVEVIDGADARPEQARSWPWDTEGRGLVLVNALVDEWGVEGLDGKPGGTRAKRVWIRVTSG